MIDLSKIKIGLRFQLNYGKQKQVYVIEDILKTFNSKNELVKTEYLIKSTFVGLTVQKLVPLVSIQRGEEV